MRIFLSSLMIFIYGIFTEVYVGSFSRCTARYAVRGTPLTSRRLIRMADRCFLMRRQFLNMCEKLNLEIANRRKM